MQSKAASVLRSRYTAFIRKLSDEAFKEISNAFNGRENGYLTNGLDSRDNYYMKRVYLTCVRAIDFLISLPEWDGKKS